jgi:serine/threonine protein kinase
MELLGKNLEEVAPKNGMDERTVAKIAVHLVRTNSYINLNLDINSSQLSALEFIHSRGVIHRDIKPANILLTLDHPPNLRLIDFGIARPFKIGIPTQCDPIQERRNVPGTLHWVSLKAQLGYGALSLLPCSFYLYHL